MNSQIGRFGLVVAALCGVVLAGCNAVEDVRDEPYTAVPTPTVVLQGTITGLGSRRSLVLVNNGNNNAALSFQASVPTKPTTAASVTPFSFGSVPVGSPYAITVRQQPYGKLCTIQNGSGTITTAEALHISIDCVDNVPRYSITVTVADSFASAPGAKVTLTTEEAVFEKTPVPGTSTLVFPNAVFDATPGGTIQPVNTWTVTASTTEGGTLNKCIVQNPTNPSVSGVSQNPTANIGVAPAAATTFPTVGRTAGSTAGLSPCLFTISGTVSYSRPAPASGVVTDPPMGAGGVTLELRDVQGQPVVVAPTGVNVSSFSATGAANAFTLTTIGKSNSSGVFDVVVTRHPDGQRCVVGNGGSASLYVTGLTNPANITNLAVYCRNIPIVANQLKGTYRFTNRVLTTLTQAAGTPLPPITSATTTSTWLPFDFSVQNTASSNMLTFFDDGTFLYGTHSSSTQVEHGFYEYVPAAGAVLPKIRFSLITDTNTSLTAETGGLSYMPGRSTTTVTPVTGGTAVTLQHRSLVNVVRTVLPNGLHRISGTFGLLEGTNPAPAAPPANVAPTAQPSQLDWQLTEPQSVNGEWTGTWISQDHRRFFVWDFATNYGTQVGVHGGAVSMNDACFTTEDLHAPSGFYSRRGSITGCYPWNRPFTNQFYLISGAEAVDFASPAGLPGFIGRIPGGQTAFDGRSPSPLYFFVAPASTFAGITDQEIFPSPVPAATPSKTPFNSGGFPTWCTTDILGMRATLNGAPIDYPHYFCRTRAN